MRKNKQLIVDKDSGDCFRACLTSILDLPNGDWLCTVGDKAWFSKYYNFLSQFGLTFRWEPKACWQQGYWIALVPSLNFPGLSHVIIMSDYYVYFDPTTSDKKYEEGRSLLGEKVVQGGYIFMVEDMSKLHELCIFREKMNQK